ncbi:MAG: transcriptional regulator [Chloroflexi bacterium CG07_land_8_20_14_0_80_45_17]|nr:MAG: transcriptional regulator [Chloroflexi bacterium CG07_land_8_20_14_0_80_45_17]
MGLHNSHRGIPALPFCHISLKGQKPLSRAYPQQLKTLGDHLRKKRLNLKLLQREVALILGVEEATIWNWEKNRTSPPVRYLPRIIKFLGYSPFENSPQTLGQRVLNYRRLYGITQKELAHRLGIDPTTLARWERDKGRPMKRQMEKLVAFLGSVPSNAGGLKDNLWNSFYPVERGTM